MFRFLVVFFKLQVSLSTLNIIQFSILDPFFFFCTILKIIQYQYFTNLGQLSGFDLLFVLMFSYDSNRFISSSLKTCFCG